MRNEKVRKGMTIVAFFKTKIGRIEFGHTSALRIRNEKVWKRSDIIVVSSRTKRVG